MPLPLAEVVRGTWRPGIGDPTAFGWATVAAYALAALACAFAARRDRGARPARFWGVLACGLVLLGINKQLDLQSLITTMGRRAIQTGGLYAYRRAYQLLYVAAVGVAGVLALGTLAWLSRGASWPRRLALAGAVFLAAFVVARAASFHHVDQLLKIQIAGARVNALLELGGIACVGLAALWAAHRS